MKEIIKRSYLAYVGANEEVKEGYFKNTGIWGNGKLAYSRLDEDMKPIPNEEGAYYQIRYKGKLVMERV